MSRPQEVMNRLACLNCATPCFQPRFSAGKTFQPSGQREKQMGTSRRRPRQRVETLGQQQRRPQAALPSCHYSIRVCESVHRTSTGTMRVRYPNERMSLIVLPTSAREVPTEASVVGSISVIIVDDERDPPPAAIAKFKADLIVAMNLRSQQHIMTPDGRRSREGWSSLPLQKGSV